MSVSKLKPADQMRNIRTLAPNILKELGAMLSPPQTNKNDYRVLAGSLGYTLGEVEASCRGQHGDPGFELLHDWSKGEGRNVGFLLTRLEEMERHDIARALIESLDPDVTVVFRVHGATTGCQGRQMVAKTKKDTMLKDALRGTLAEEGLSPEQLVHGKPAEYGWSPEHRFASDSSVWCKPVSDFIKGEISFFEKQENENGPCPRGRLNTAPTRPLGAEEAQLRIAAKTRTAFSTPDGDHTKRNAMIGEHHYETIQLYQPRALAGTPEERKGADGGASNFNFGDLPRSEGQRTTHLASQGSSSSSSLMSADSSLSTGCPSQAGGTGFADSDTGCESTNDELASEFDGIYLTTSGHIPGYHHELRRGKDCERFLRKNARQDFEYITRPTGKDGILAIGVFTKEQILHFKVQQTITEDGQTVVYIYPNAFTASGISKLLDYYRDHPISNNGSDKGPYLRYPLEKNGSR